MTLSVQDLDGWKVVSSVLYDETNKPIEINDALGFKEVKRYAPNGNLISKKHDGQNDVYTYNEFGQLVKLVQGQFKYKYEYDAKGNRTKQTKTDLKDYHYDVFFNYDVPYKKVTQKIFHKLLKMLRNNLKLMNQVGIVKLV